jgi:hypothetical protein
MRAITLLAVACLLAPGCFNPEIADGLSCGPDDECPPGYDCADDDKCYPEGEGPDIDAGTDDPDASLFPDWWPCDPIGNLGCGENEQCATVADGPAHWTSCVPWGNRSVGAHCSGILGEGVGVECAPTLQCAEAEQMFLYRCFEVCYRYLGEDSCESPSFCVQIEGIFDDLTFDDDPGGFVGMCTN